MTAHAQAPSAHGAPAAPPGKHTLFVVVGIVFVALAAIAVTALSLHRRHRVAAERGALEEEVAHGPKVRVIRIETTKEARVLSLPGDVHGFDQATLYAKLSGYIEEIHVDRGDRVTKGELLATIGSPETQDDVVAAEHNASIAKITASRYEGLAPAGIVSRQDRDTAEAQQHVTQAELGRARSLMRYTRVRAPFDGIVTARYVDPGALVPAATGSTQALLPIVDLASVDTLRVFVYVGQDGAPFIHPGDGAEVWQDELPERRIPAKVTHVAGALDPRTRTMQVELDVDNRPWGMLPGTFAHVEIHVAEAKTALLPADALVIRDGKTMAAEVEGGRVRYVPIDLGYNDGRNIRVLHGLSGGETVGLGVPIEVADGDVVQVVSQPPEAQGPPPAK
jgi:membrane fusion protein (multidrug efflux system)